MKTDRPSLPTSVGHPDAFEIRFELDKNYCDEWLFGKICYQIGNFEVGDYSLGTSLRDVLLQMHLIVSDAGLRKTARFLGMEKEKLFSIVCDTLYGDEKTGMEDVANDECWAKHNIAIPVNVFDHVHVFQFDEEKISRILWKSLAELGKSTVNEVVLPLGTTEYAFQELQRQLEKLTDWEKTMRLKT